MGRLIGEPAYQITGLFLTDAYSLIFTTLAAMAQYKPLKAISRFGSPKLVANNSCPTSARYRADDFIPLGQRGPRMIARITLAVALGIASGNEGLTQSLTLDCVFKRQHGIG